MCRGSKVNSSLAKLIYCIYNVGSRVLQSFKWRISVPSASNKPSFYFITFFSYYPCYFWIYKIILLSLSYFPCLLADKHTFSTPAEQYQSFTWLYLPIVQSYRTLCERIIKALQMPQNRRASPQYSCRELLPSFCAMLWLLTHLSTPYGSTSYFSLYPTNYLQAHNWCSFANVTLWNIILTFLLYLIVANVAIT